MILIRISSSFTSTAAKAQINLNSETPGRCFVCATEPSIDVEKAEQRVWHSRIRWDRNDEIINAEDEIDV
jgi:hypothetical protein